MILYRPHRGGFQEAMALAREFESIDAMKEYIVKEHTDEDMGPAFSVEDIVIGEEEKYDPRNGWYTRYICTKRYYWKNFTIPQCIGMCGKVIENWTREMIAEKTPCLELQSQIREFPLPPIGAVSLF